MSQITIQAVYHANLYLLYAVSIVLTIVYNSEK